MKYINLFILLLLILNAAGCGTKKEDESNPGENQVPQVNTQKQDARKNIEVMVNFTPEEEKIKNKILKVLQQNLEATQNENVAAVLETIHENSPKLSSTKKGNGICFLKF